jgi:hypothetical protein
VNGEKVWSTKITEKLNKELKNHAHTGLTLMALIRRGGGGYEVIHHGETLPNGDFKNFKYTVQIEEGMMSKCTSLKPNLTGISYSHILAVIRIRKFELN